MTSLANCPKNGCDLSDSNFDFEDWDEENVNCRVTCKGCGAEWTEVYRHDYTDTDELDEEAA
jgi:hypothetical protein